VPSDPADPRGYGVGAELMFGQIISEKSDEPVLLIRFATQHPIWFRRGSRSLGYDFLSPSGGGGLDLDGGWDVIHFNHGVWDQAILDPKTGQRAEPGKGVIRIAIADYEKNLRTIVARLKQTKATLIWASTTPILEGTPPGYVGGEMVDKYNAVAAKVMQENGVLIDDLNAECRRMGKPKALNVHDVGDLAPKVTETVLAALKAHVNPSRPLPRVLFIGDSITGSYWEKVKSNLDGKAFVAKNPGNGEHSGTGARLVNEWVDLKQYLLNGQEYLELVKGVKEVLANFDRYCPDFAGGAPELAGFVWFQGIADAQSDAFTAAYEKNLAGFVHDVRREFNRPALPVVIAALGQYGNKMMPNTRKIHDAQLAVGDPAKHPEFKGNVTSINTIPFYFSKEKSPGGREWDYYSNAESFLLIGEAMGKAMVELQSK
jgi:lysophospholipase L1-like esterase